MDLVHTPPQGYTVVLNKGTVLSNSVPDAAVASGEGHGPPRGVTAT